MNLHILNFQYVSKEDELEKIPFIRFPMILPMKK